LTERGAHELCERLLGRAPDEVEPLIVWDHRATYRCRIGNEAFVVKRDDDGRELAREAEGQAHAAAHGVPVPELLAVEPGEIAMRFVAGEQLGPASPKAAWRNAAVIVEHIHSVPQIGEFGGGFVRPGDDWFHAVLAGVDAHLPRAEQHGLAPEAGRRLRQRVVDAKPMLDRAPTTWLHGDLQTDHVLFDARTNEITAVLDWSDHGRGDPLWDDTILSFFDPAKLALLAHEHGDDTAERLDLLREVRWLADVCWFSEHAMHDEARAALEHLSVG